MTKRMAWPALAALALTLGLAAAPAATAAPVTATTASQPALSQSLSVPQSLSPELQQIVDNLPAMREHAAAVKAELGIEDNPVQAALLEAIDPTQYECSSALPPVVSAILPDVSNWTFEQTLAVLHVLLFDIALVDAAYLPQPGPYTYGARGEYTNQVNRNIRDLKTFWDIPSGDIDLVPAHGRSMLDPEVNYRVFTSVYGLAPGPSRISADLVARELNSAALGYGDLPFFTFNAYAAPGGEDMPFGKSPKRIAMGDGVLDGFGRVGLGDVAPQAILAHEYGHHVQFADGLMRTDLPTPEATRWAELMADAYSSYFLTHARGAAMQWKRVELFGEMFYQLGDCGFTADGHHGTPNQRMRSALWAYSVADAARPQGTILPARSFYDLFVTQYPTLIAPDTTS
ncbi:hypothetical protein EV643_104230 [Kribbella sp. VKM Ac-2527]|uniref:DUF2268 domain-containing protein n=1 Tax=Kribbella caucasensis TaxID=2512215 RepID=A0A4R6KLR1_9ACTN|nr:hypothetical protein [Kribbella sp. VKM Ac-2527]TDO50736.1 hypothetical protein EV643_104230 [Kribbella sp. VKM Ac-2527]